MKYVLILFLIIFVPLYVLSVILSPLYFKFGWFSYFYHDVMGWCQPTDEYWSDGCSAHSRCKHCGKEIMQDSQGNWF